MGNNDEAATKINDTPANKKQESHAHIMLDEEDLHHMNSFDENPLYGTRESGFVWPATDTTASGGGVGGNYGSSFNRDDPTEAYKSDCVTSPFTRND